SDYAGIITENRNISDEILEYTPFIDNRQANGLNRQSNGPMMFNYVVYILAYIFDQEFSW
ncbi:2264_t:CDS:1, partial [Dentiscutata heterogama]